MDDVTKQHISFSTPLFKFIPTWDSNLAMHLPNQIIADFTGNQRGKTAQKARQYVLRILGHHPIPERNVLFFRCPNYSSHAPVVHSFGFGYSAEIYRCGEYTPWTIPKDGRCLVCGNRVSVVPRNTRVFRFCSETLPGNKETVDDGTGQSTEVKNTIYPEFKKWLPKMLIKKDITARLPSMTIRDPFENIDFGVEYNTADTIVEFVSYRQRTNAVAGVQRLSIWEDEEPPFDFHEEQLPRLLAENGDIHLTLTPANRMSWTFDEIFERSQIYFRTKAMADFLSSIERKKVPRIETTSSQLDIAVIQAATDDNPTLKLEAIENLISFEDPDTIATRRYGVFRQSTGRVFNDFKYKVHMIELERYFSDLETGESNRLPRKKPVGRNMGSPKPRRRSRGIQGMGTKS